MAQDIQKGVAVRTKRPSYPTTAPIAGIKNEHLAGEVEVRLVPPGTILPFGGTVVPPGFLPCEGAQVSRTTYADLFAAFGGPSVTPWGSGNGTTTFHLPDLRGYTLRGRDGGVNRDPDRASRTANNTGGSTGDNVGSVQSDQFYSHGHPINVYQDSGAGYPALMNSYVNTNYSYTRQVPAAQGAQAVGGNETRMKNANVAFIIKY